jgi:hypothetical protein
MPPFSSSLRAMPASSRMRRSLNRSFKLFREGRLYEASPSGFSSSLPSIISGLLPTVTIEEDVFLRSSLLGGATGGEGEVSFAVDVFRESHEKGLVRLLLAVTGKGVGFGLGDACGCGAFGGGPHGTEGRTPDRP